ncbi:MAG: hypothetical protein O2782_18600 [bacterium]|nr:hypothetical protein [bacterium]
MSQGTHEPQRPELSQELSRMVAEDQDAQRRIADGNGARQAHEDLCRRNLDRMKVIVAEVGWPTITMVGTDGAFDAWLLVQEADNEPEFQTHCLQLMQACAPHEVGQRLIGYLDDRIRAAAGKPQLYGTQFHAGADGRPEPWPIEDPDKLDERRATIGLGPFDEYRRQVEGD